MAVHDNSGDRNNFTILPNIVFWLGLSPHALALYAHIKQTAGEVGYCNKRTETLAYDLEMSTGTVSAAKAELVKHDLIEIAEEPRKEGGKPRHCITVLDIWHRNDMAVQLRKSLRSTDEQAISQCEQAISHTENAISTGEINKIPSTNKNLKNKIKENKREGETKSVSPAKKPLFPIAKALSEVCCMNFEPNKGRLFREAEQLARASPAPTPDLIHEKYNGGGWWAANDWRGKKGERPTPATIRETWGQWLLPQRINPTVSDLLDAAFERRRKRGDGIDNREDIKEIHGTVSADTS